MIDKILRILKIKEKSIKKKIQLYEGYKIFIECNYNSDFLKHKKYKNMIPLPLHIRASLDSSTKMLEHYIFLSNEIDKLNNKLTIMGLKEFFKKNKILPIELEKEIISFF